MAWRALDGAGQEPVRHDVSRWTDDENEDELRRLAWSIEPRIDDVHRLLQWQSWQQQALYGHDPFYNVPIIPKSRVPDPPLPKLVIHFTTEPAPAPGRTPPRHRKKA